MHAGQRTISPHSSHASADVSRLMTRRTRRPAASVSRTARASGGVSGSRRRMPRVSATCATGHGPGSTPPRSARPPSARHQVSTLGVAEVSITRSCARAPRSTMMSRECKRGGPGGLCAASCSSTSASVAPGGSGASRAERVPTASETPPSRSPAHALARSVSSASESSRATRPRRASRCAQRAAASMSGTTTSAGPLPISSSNRVSRPAPMRSSGFRCAPDPVTGRAGRSRELSRTGHPRLDPRSRSDATDTTDTTGGSSAASVPPSDDSDCVAIQRASSTASTSRTGLASSRRTIDRRRGSSALSRTPTTMPVRWARPSGATTRCPTMTGQSSGTRYENGCGSGTSNAMSATVTAFFAGRTLAWRASNRPRPCA